MHALNRFKQFIWGSIVILSLTSCAYMHNTNSVKNSSLVDFLYPGEEYPMANQEMTHLNLPLKVGLAFTPSLETQYSDLSLSEASKKDLLSKISTQFMETGFVQSIQLIPSSYLRRAGSFENLDQVKSLLDVDVVMLLSYDQSNFTDEGFASLSYWTIIGAYIIPGEKNDTHTLIDAAVYDIASRKMLFRAPGSSTVQSRGTLVNNSSHLREDSLNGFHLASDDLIHNLTIQLGEFTENVKNNPQQFEVNTRDGYSAMGSFTGLDLLFSIIVLVMMLAMNIHSFNFRPQLRLKNGSKA